MRRLRFVAAAVMVLLLAGLFVLLEVGFYRTTDGARMAMRRINQRIHYGLGYQLPGTPDLTRLDERLSEKGFKRGDPIFIRIFKSELTLELWMRKGDRFELFASYPICYWSGRLGPKIRTGDRQAPEGFYTVVLGGDGSVPSNNLCASFLESRFADDNAACASAVLDMTSILIHMLDPDVIFCDGFEP